MEVSWVLFQNCAHAGPSLAVYKEICSCIFHTVESKDEATGSAQKLQDPEASENGSDRLEAESPEATKTHSTKCVAVHCFNGGGYCTHTPSLRLCANGVCFRPSHSTRSL